MREIMINHTARTFLIHVQSYFCEYVHKQMFYPFEDLEQSNQ